MKVLPSICQQIWKTQQGPQDWKRSVVIPIPKKGNAKECSNYHTIAPISHIRKVTVKILQARLQQYMNYELPDAQVGFRKGKATEIKFPTSTGSSQKQESSIKQTKKKNPKSIYFCFSDYTKTFDFMDDNKLCKILKEMVISDHLTCLLRNLYTHQGVTVRTGHGTTDWFQIGKGVQQGGILSSCLFKLYTEYIM